MPARERAKGQRGERIVRRIFEQAGCEVESLQRNQGETLDLLVNRKLYVDVKYQERFQLLMWLRETEEATPDGLPHIVAFKRARSPWYGAGRLDDLVRLAS